MAENAVSSIGTGITLQGRVPDYAGLAYRMGQDKEIRKKKESDTEARDLEFDQSALKDIYPYYANQILQRRVGLINQYQQDKAQFGQIQARNNLILAKTKAQALDAIDMGNSRKAGDLIAKDKLTNIIPNQDALNAAVNKPNATDQDWAAFNDPDLGFNADGGNIQGTAIPRMNLPDYLQKQYTPVPSHEDKPAPKFGARAIERTPVFNYSGEDKQKAVNEILGDEIKFKNFLAQNKEWLKQYHPDALQSNNPDDNSRLAEQKAAVMDFAQVALPTTRKESKIEHYDYPPQGTQSDRDAQKTQVEENVKQIGMKAATATEPAGVGEIDIPLRVSLQSKNETGTLKNNGRAVNAETGKSIADPTIEIRTKGAVVDYAPVKDKDSGKVVMQPRILATALVRDEKVFNDVKQDIWAKRTRNLITIDPDQYPDTPEGNKKAKEEAKPSDSDVLQSVEYQQSGKREMPVYIPYKGNEGLFTNSDIVNKEISDWNKRNPQGATKKAETKTKKVDDPLGIFD